MTQADTQQIAQADTLAQKQTYSPNNNHIFKSEIFFFSRRNLNATQKISPN